MMKLVKKDSAGRTVYDGILTSEEKIPAEALLKFLQSKIPELEKALAKEYGRGVLYKYHYGKAMQKLLEDNRINETERRMFWDEIKDFATTDKRKRNDGKKSKTRSFQEQCFILSQIDIVAVKKLSWRQWQDLLDRVLNREDERIYEWIKKQTEKIREDDWREFEKILFSFLKNKDTSVFTVNELFNIYDSILLMAQIWRKKFSELIKKNSNPKKIIQQKGRMIKKYIEVCFQKRRELKREINDAICEITFFEIFK